MRDRNQRHCPQKIGSTKVGRGSIVSDQSDVRIQLSAVWIEGGATLSHCEHQALVIPMSTVITL